MGSLKSNSNRNFASDDDEGFLFDARAWSDPGKSWFDLVLANIDRTKYRNIFSLICKYFPTVSGCLTADRLTAGCCSVKSRPGAGILILHLQSPAISPPLSSAAVGVILWGFLTQNWRSWPKYAKCMEKRRHFCCITHIAQLTDMTFLSPEVKYIKYIRTK